MVFVISSIVNFLVVLAILWHFGRKPIAKFFSDRSVTVETAINEAQTQYEAAEKGLAQWERSWNSREVFAKEIQDEANVTVDRLRQHTLESARHEASRIREEGKLLAKSETQKVRRELQSELAERSVWMARQYLEKQLDDRDKHRLVADYVEILSNGAHG